MTEENVIQSLLEYIGSTTARRGLAYAETPTRMSGGFDATIIGFSLRGAPEPFSGPLVLRLFQANADGRRAPREAAIQNALAELGYPAPRVLVAEERTEPLGGALLIMERMPGHPLGWKFEALRIKGVGHDTHRSLKGSRRKIGGSAQEGRASDQGPRTIISPVSRFLTKT